MRKKLFGDASWLEIAIGGVLLAAPFVAILAAM